MGRRKAPAVFPEDVPAAVASVPALREALADMSLDFDVELSAPDKAEARHLTGKESPAARMVNEAILRRHEAGAFGISEHIVMVGKLAACKLLPDHVRKSRARLCAMLREAGFRHMGSPKVHGRPEGVYVREPDGERDDERAGELWLEAKERWGIERQKRKYVKIDVRRNLAKSVRRIRGQTRTGASVELVFGSKAEAVEFIRAMDIFKRKVDKQMMLC